MILVVMIDDEPVMDLMMEPVMVLRWKEKVMI